jgi:hypothetical protein
MLREESVKWAARTPESTDVSTEVGQHAGRERLHPRGIVAVAVVGALIGAALLFTFLASRPIPPPGTMVPFASIYHDPLSKLDVMLTGGDGHAFAVIAEDPTLSRPDVLRVPKEFAYRAQRPVWGYLTWAVSGGQARFTGWALVALTILSCGAACAVAGWLLLARGRSAWWALLVPLVGFETLTEATPELFSAALVGLGVILWSRRRRASAVAVLTIATLTRETMLLAVGALALWAFFTTVGSVRGRIRLVLPLAIPFLAYAGWIVFLRVHVGNWPFNRSGDRLGLPGSGLLDALGRHTDRGFILFWVAVGTALCVASIIVARRDVLTWITVTFGLFALLLGPDVWLTNAGFQRALLPLYVFGPIAVLGGLAKRTPQIEPATDWGTSVDAQQRREEPAGVALRSLGHVLR